MQLLTGYRTDRSDTPWPTGGDFVVGSMEPTNGHAVSSVIGATPWFYTTTPDGRLVQGESVFEVCREAGLRWEWNPVAIRQIACLGHTLGGHSLHSGIVRMPPDTRVEWDGSELRLVARPDGTGSWTWDQEGPEASFEALQESFLACLPARDEPVLVSLSAGYDSRLLLALCLANGRTPKLVVMGPEQATDVTVSRAIAEALGLSLQQIPLRAEDYIAFGAEISHLTSGQKTASDWHSWLYPRSISEKGRVHLIGSNGEFARSYYRDVVARSAPAGWAGRRGLRAYLGLRMLNRARKYRHLGGLLSGGRVLGDVRRIRLPASRYPSGFLPACDAFYAAERVRHFIGFGLRCAQRFGRPRSPFLDRRWMRSVAAVKRDLKQGEWYPTEAIRRNWPELLGFPFNRQPGGGPPISYSPFREVAGLEATREILAGSEVLERWVSESQRAALLRMSPEERLEETSLLLTLHFAGINAAECAGAGS